ncbi:MAG: type II secretion system minor pseudopilin GspH [Halobacteria archaeon]|nr:type II secretion system minor pseudopilin GspH [Halobacteria archaeon]
MRAHPAVPAGVAAGFTLLELMVVLVLVGIIFTFAMLSFGGDDIAEMMEEETRRLETLIRLAADESVIRGQELAIRFTGEGYEFMELQETGWQVPENDRLLRAHTLPPEVQVRLQVEGDAPVFPDQQSDENAVTPQVFILSSGEVTPFTAVFESRQSPAQFHLDVTVMGEINMERAQTL